VQVVLIKSSERNYDITVSEILIQDIENQLNVPLENKIRKNTNKRNKNENTIEDLD
jgi:hypothetical protein